MTLFCDNPVIIVNPQINEYIYQYHHYIVDGEFINVHDVRTFSHGRSLKYFSPRKMGVTLENIDRFGVLTDSGFKPMFFAVPCGKCVLCREKKASEWSFRAFIGMELKILRLCSCEFCDYMLITTKIDW
jgi:hypothetical protein